MKNNQKTQFDKVSFQRSYIDMILRIDMGLDILTDFWFEDDINEFGTEKQKELYERRIKEVK